MRKGRGVLISIDLAYARLIYKKPCFIVLTFSQKQLYDSTIMVKMRLLSMFTASMVGIERSLPL
jgi:hypothetical protein